MKTILSTLKCTFPLWEIHKRALPKKDYRKFSVVVQIVEDNQKSKALSNDELKTISGGETTQNIQKITLDNGVTIIQGYLFEADSVFEKMVSLRSILSSAVEYCSKKLAIDLSATSNITHPIVLYSALINFADMPTFKTIEKKDPIKNIHVFGCGDHDSMSKASVQAEANTFARGLTTLPGNKLSPEQFVDIVKRTAKKEKFKCSIINMKQLRNMQVGGFLAVAEGSNNPSYIAKLQYTPKNSVARISLIGKGVCFDTGGYNLKSSRHLIGMHKDMSGAAVALATMVAVNQLRLPISINCWLGITENHISPNAYRPGDVITSFSGKTIEIVNTDAEGRIIMADLLSLAMQENQGTAKDDLIVSYATLTGSMIAALGTKMSGAFATKEWCRSLIASASERSGERTWLFPLEKDYRKCLESDSADILQCTVDGDGDHIFAACFLKEFIGENMPWIHLDLSSSFSKGGLGAVNTDITGFGVTWTIAALQELANKAFQKCSKDSKKK